MIEQLLQDIAARGWLVNNLFQVDDGSWQGNIRIKPRFDDSRKFLTTAMAYSESVADVLVQSINNIATAKDPGLPPIEVLADMGKSNLDLRAQLSHLLKPKTKGLTRRV